MSPRWMFPNQTHVGTWLRKGGPGLSWAMKWRLPCHHFQHSLPWPTIPPIPSLLPAMSWNAPWGWHITASVVSPWRTPLPGSELVASNPKALCTMLPAYVQKFASGGHFPLLEFLSKFGTWALLQQFFISYYVWSNHKSYPSNPLSKQLFNQANNDPELPAGYNQIWAKECWKKLAAFPAQGAFNGCSSLSFQFVHQHMLLYI